VLRGCGTGIRASSQIPLTMASGAVMQVKMKANTVPVVMAASCCLGLGFPALLPANITRR
jgi:hypothetical protein